MANLRVNFAGLDFKNPLVVASGTMTKDHDRMLKCVESGVSGFVVKTPVFDPRDRLNACPRFYVSYPDGVSEGKFYSLYSQEIFAELTPEELCEHVGKVRSRAEESDCKIIVSLAGYTIEEWEKLAELFEPVADMFELMMLVTLHDGKFGGDVETAPQIVRTVKKVTNLPLMAKLAPDMGDVVPVIKSMEKEGLDAVNLTMNVGSLEIDIESASPIVLPVLGFWSGPWLAPISRRLIAHAALATRLPISGHGGLDNWRDAIAHMMAGATTVQMCGAAILRGYKFFAETIEGMDAWLDSHSHASVRDIIGAALSNLISWEFVPRKDKFKPTASVIPEKCDATICSLCEDICYYDAAKINIEEGKAKIDEEKCDGCGLCIQRCPYSAIELRLNDKVIPTTWKGVRGREAESERETEKVESQSLIGLWQESNLINLEEIRKALEKDRLSSIELK